MLIKKDVAQRSFILFEVLDVAEADLCLASDKRIGNRRERFDKVGFLFGERLDEIEPFIASKLLQIPEKLRGLGMLSRVRNTYFALPLGIDQIVKTTGAVCGLNTLHVVENTYGNQTPGGHLAVLVLELLGKLLRRWRNVFGQGAFRLQCKV
jgi:hypothetical protein